MKLYLMRHGHAASKMVDPERGLTSEGKTGIEQLAHKLAQQEITFKQVFHSEKARAQQTAEIMTAILAPDVKPVCRKSLKPDDNPEELLADIDLWQDDTLIASHLPFIPGLLGLLTHGEQSVAFEPGTIVCLNKEGSDWQLDWVNRP